MHKFYITQNRFSNTRPLFRYNDLFNLQMFINVVNLFKSQQVTNITQNTFIQILNT